MKTKEEIITGMCYTYRHDYGLRKSSDPGGYTFPFEAGMTEQEAIMLYKQWNRYIITISHRCYSIMMT